MKKFLILTVAFFALFSCSLDDDDSNFRIETLPIKEALVPSAFEYGLTYSLKVIYELPSDCHSFHSLYYQYDENSRIVAINSFVNLNLACADVITETEFEFEVNVTQQEDYIFRFWKGKDTNGEDIFEDITVEVMIAP